MIGLWDAARDATPRPWKSADQLERDAAEGHLFLLHTGSDGGGLVDIFIDEDLPPVISNIVRPLGREYLLTAPSGRVVVGGVEDYRSAKPRITGDNSVLTLPAGDYRLRCYAMPDEDEVERSEESIAKAVGAENLRYFDRMTNLGVGIGCATPVVIFPLLLFLVSWKIALPVAIVAFVGYFHVMQWFLQRNRRYAELDKLITPMRSIAEPPQFVFELRRITDRAGLTGGSVHVDA